MDLDNIRKSFIFIIITIILAAYGELHNNCSISIDSRSKVVPIHYNISFDPDVKAVNKSMLSKSMNKYKYLFFVGKSSATISIFRSTQTIRLFEDYKINERIVYIVSAKLIKSNGIVYKQFINFDSDILELRSNASTLHPGLYTLQIKFIRGTRNEKEEGFFRWYHRNEDEYTLLKKIMASLNFGQKLTNFE
jgi:hypothetical protein